MAYCFETIRWGYQVGIIKTAIRDERAGRFGPGILDRALKGGDLWHLMKPLLFLTKKISEEENKQIKFS